VWRRHLHKYEAMDQAEAEAHAEQLKGRVLAARKAKGQAKAAAAAEARAAEKSKSKAGAAAGQVRTERGTAAKGRKHLWPAICVDCVAARQLRAGGHCTCEAHALNPHVPLAHTCS
jgi:hypothetical protein